MATPRSVIPTKAGTYLLPLHLSTAQEMGPRFRGDDDNYPSLKPMPIEARAWSASLETTG